MEDTQKTTNPFARIDNGGRANALLGILPGVTLSALLAGLAFVLRDLTGIDSFSPLILSLLLGMGFHNLVGTPELATRGVGFGLRQVLRLGIVLLGLQVTLNQLAAIGGAGLAVILLTLAGTFSFTIWLGRVLNVEAGLTKLIAAGSSICGASAVVAANTVIRAEDEDVAYAVACVTVFGTFSMLAMPAIATAVSMDPHSFGLWTGATIHEVAQVAGAAFALGEEAGEVGTVAKLARVVMLAPVVLAMGLAETRRMRNSGMEAGAAAPQMPWFVIGFIALVCVASTGIVNETTKHFAATATQFLLAVALAAMGLQTRLGMLVAKGIRPALLGAVTWVFISLLGLGLVLVLQ